MKHAAPAATSSAVDLRGFSYPLEPYLRKQEWQLERLEGRMARLQHTLSEALAQGRVLQAGFDEQALQMQQAVQNRLDPRLYQRGLVYLAQARCRIDEQGRQIESLQAQRNALKTECIAQQRTIDGLQEHRTAALRDYTQEVARLAAAEADRDWIGRMPLRVRSEADGLEVLA